MRATLLVSLVALFTVSASAQDFGTVYVTPPTSGCNGVWAVQITSVYCTSTSPYTFEMEPSGCLQLDWGEQMGNFLIPLCAIPCSLTVTTGDGVTCSGSTSDTPIGMNEHSAPTVNVSVNDAVIEVSSSSLRTQLVARITDLEGRSVSTRNLSPGRTWQIPAPETAGVYLLVLDGMETPITKRFVVTK
ncbi:MAG TPA: hypothetical protein PLB89_11035 [Flavobacteriales bacterium]|nr:hypothetical protein [Flavobacteriales bacterium]